MSPAMGDMARCLEHALIVYVDGIRPEVSTLDVDRVLQLERSLSSVHPFFPENYLVVFDSISVEDHILREGPIRTDRFLLLLK